MQLQNIMIFGDSIMKGVVLNESEKRYNISSALGVDAIAGRFGLSIENRSRFGCTIEKGFAMLRRTLDRHTDCGAVVLEYGGNDCDFDWAAVSAAPESEHEPRTPIERFTAVYGSMLDYLKEKSVLPILMNLPPLCAERYLNWVCRDGASKERILHWLGDANAIYRYHERYSHAIERIAEERALPLVDLRSAFLAERQMEKLFCLDGIHPNEAGQRLIRDVFSNFLETAPAVS